MPTVLYTTCYEPAIRDKVQKTEFGGILGEINNNGGGKRPATVAGHGMHREGMDRLFDLTFAELRSLARTYMSRERGNHTLQPTALVNEAYLRLINVEGLHIESRNHFGNLAAQAMRRILVEHARAKNAVKRGGAWQFVTMTDLGLGVLPDEVGLVDLDDALKVFAQLDERGAKVVELRIFGGLTMQEIAEVLGVTRRTVQTDWRIAIMWLRREFAEP